MKIIALGITLGIMSLAASAQAPGPQRAKRHLVAQGVRSGQLTRLEVHQLARQEHRIHIARRRAHRDGVITPMERSRIHHMQQLQRRSYFVKKHNTRRRWQ